MNAAKLYKGASKMQRRDAQVILQEYANILKWKSDGNDSLLDIGCGSGDVTIDYLLPLLPCNFERLIGCDVSEAMVTFANDNFKYPRVSFVYLDIGGDIDQITQPFDHITSFYCLHWIQNQKKAITNIYNLLVKNGDCLITFLANHPIFDIYEKMASLERWSKYKRNVYEFISPYQKDNQPDVTISDLMIEAGFTEVIIEIKKFSYVYEGLDDIKNSVRAVNPFLQKIPLSMHNDYLDDYVNIVLKMNLAQPNELDLEKCKFVTPYKLIVAYARK